MRHRAVFTIVQNEPIFLPLWLRYYGHYFHPSDIYVLDHDSTDGSTKGVAQWANLLHVHRDKSFDHNWLRDTVASFQVFLLRSYENVVFTEADEFVVADPARYSGLDDYITHFHERAARCAGFNVTHFREEEPALRFDQPILAQRKYWRQSGWYSKVLLAKTALSWSIGFHREETVSALRPDPELLLLHLRWVDYDYCMARLRSTAARDWNEEDVRVGLGMYSRAQEEELGKWFGRRHEEGDLQPIPERLKDLL